MRGTVELNNHNADASNANKNNSHSTPAQNSQTAKEPYPLFRPTTESPPKGVPLEVAAEHGLERAIKVLKRKMIKDGIYKELKARRFYEKPSEQRKRQLKERLKKLSKERAKRQKAQYLF
ncbi:MAG: 30S ribosomal protein S21 [Candidatus Dadabacteria bacterium]|nr:MAG: 30S ribosomal protein S21 [Candidatus Dadabacteria bacterium]